MSVITRAGPFAALAVLGLVLWSAGPAGAQGGRDGCYFGECPGGRPPPTGASPAPPPPPRPAATPPRTQQRPAPTPARTAGPRIGGDFCRVIGEIADMVGDDFAPVTGRRVSEQRFEARRSLPGADVCGVFEEDGARTFLCVWQVEGADLARVLAEFVGTVSTCFDEAESEEVEALSHRIWATDEADIIVVGDAKEKRVILEIGASTWDENEDEEEEQR